MLEEASSTVEPTMICVMSEKEATPHQEDTHLPFKNVNIFLYSFGEKSIIT